MHPISRQRQRGASFISWLVVLALLGLAITIGLRLVPIYLHAYTVESIVRDVVDEAQKTNLNANEIWSSIARRLDINDIDDIKRENFAYTRAKGMVTVAIKYEARTDLIGNLDAVANFDIAETFAEGTGE
jgi:hypothetical protein